MKKVVITVCLLIFCNSTVLGSGYGVFTQGASGLGQGNAVVAHPTGPSSVYFNPALLNQVEGRQIEFGTTGIYAERSIDLDSGGSVDSDNSWEFPSTFYYTHKANEKIAAGIGVFFPFGLSSKWPADYEGRYIGTEGEITTMNINPVMSYQATERLSLAAGLNFLYFDATLKSRINQQAIALGLPPELGGPIPDPSIGDATQSFSGEDWGVGFNLGLLFNATEKLSLGATYRSHIDVEADGDVSFSGVDPRYPQLNFVFRNEEGSAKIRLPAQATFGVAYQFLDNLVLEAGLRWEDWDSTEKLTLKFDGPVLGQTSTAIPRNWSSTWSYNIGGQFRLNDTVALNAGYLFGDNAVPGSTFEPLIPDTDAHLFTVGTDLTFGAWTLSGAFGWEHHEDRTKNNTIGDPVLAQAGVTAFTANGNYETDIYLVGVSVGYRF